MKNKHFHIDKHFAWTSGKTRKETIIFDHDEYIKDGVQLEKLSTLRPAFAKDGTVTAANASGINDGAAAMTLMNESELKNRNMDIISNQCEVPEFKQACLSGIYALKNAVRFIKSDAPSLKAIVVCSDIALYQIGTSGEPTQGAGAIAALIEKNPKIAVAGLNPHAGEHGYADDNDDKDDNNTRPTRASKTNHVKMTHTAG